MLCSELDLQTTIAATMFPHLVTRMFCAKDANVMRKGLASMNFTFFIIQLSSMITGGWDTACI